MSATSLELIGGRLCCGRHAVDVASAPLGVHVVDLGQAGDPARLGARVLRGEDGRLRRVRAELGTGGRLTIRIEPAAARAEARALRVEAFWLVVDAEPDGVVLAARADGGGIVRGRRGRLDLEALAAASGGEARWNLFVQCADGRRLRLARHGDGVAGKHGRAVLPAWTGDGTRARAVFTPEDAIDVVVGPDAAVRTDRGDGGEAAVSLRRRVLIGPALVAHRAMLALLRVLPAPRRADPDVLRIVVGDAWAMGGTVRAVLDLAARIAETRPVEVISLARHHRRPFFGFPGAVTVRALDDRVAPAGRAARLLRRLPSVLIHPDDHARPWGSLLADVRLARVLRRSTGVVIATRPAFAIAAAAAARPGARVVVQEHMHVGAHRPRLARAALRACRRAAAIVVLTEQDRADLTAALDGNGPPVVRIPNALTELGDATADPGAAVVVAAGRLTRQKGFDLLIRAFAMIAEQHPDWTLRIHGRGPQRPLLERLIAEEGLGDRVLLMGPSRQIGAALAEGSVFVLSSRFEGFGMVLVEAMSRGLAVVGFACPRGPAEIVTPNRDGLLARPENVVSLARALDAALSDEALRRRLGAQAQRTARRYAPGFIGAQWDALLAGLAAPAPAPAPAPGVAGLEPA